MIPSVPNYSCPNCDGQLETTTDPNAFECQRCGQLTHERPRTAKIATRSDGTVLGAAVFLSRVDLEALGIEPTEADAVRYIVIDGTLRVAEPGEGTSDECAG